MLAQEQSQPLDLTPQIRIYNRNFHLRRIRHQEIAKEAARAIQQLADRPKLSHASYLILAQKMEQQLADLLGQKTKVDFEDFTKVVTGMVGLQTLPQSDQLEVELFLTQLWLLLIDYRLETAEIGRPQLESLILILCCPHALRPAETIALLSHAFPNNQQSRTRYLELHPETRDQVIDLEGLVSLWLALKHRKLSMHDDRKPPSPRPQPSFQPQISQKSRKYAEKELQKYLKEHSAEYRPRGNQLAGYIPAVNEPNHHQILYQRGMQKQKLLQTSRDQTQRESQIRRKLTAEEADRLVSNLYIKKEKREDVDQERRQEEIELKQCTFKPQTIDYLPNRCKTPDIKNYQKEVQRLEKGRKDKLKLKEAYENLGRVKNRDAGPPSFVEREKPRLILEIKVGERVEHLRLRGDQQPRLVAKKFVMRHSLDESMQEVLQSIIEEQLAAL